MAIFGPQTVASFASEADLKNFKYRLVKLNGDRMVTNCTDPGDVIIGILTDGVAEGAAGDPAAQSVVISGIAKVVAGAGDLAVGNLVTSDGSGRGVAAGSGNKFIGRCVTPAAENNVGAVLLYRGVIP